MFRHQKFLALPLLALLATAAFAPTAVAQGTKKAPVVNEETLTTRDGWSVPITYYESDKGEKAAVAILLHGKGQNQLVWKKNGLAVKLQSAGFAVITCDLRKHGTSKYAGTASSKAWNAIDFKAMASASGASELETIQDFLFKEHQAKKLNMAKVGIVACDETAPIALNWSANDWVKTPYQDAPTLAACTPRGQTVRGVALLSPAENANGLSAGQPLKFFSRLGGTPVSFLFLHGQDRSSRDVRAMHKLIDNPNTSKKVFKEAFSSKLSGADLIGRIPKADALVIAFLTKQVEETNVEWRSRLSRLKG